MLALLKLFVIFLVISCSFASSDLSDSSAFSDEQYDDSFINFKQKTTTTTTTTTTTIRPKTTTTTTTTTTTKQPVTQEKRKCGWLREKTCVKRTHCAETANNVAKIVIDLWAPSRCHYLETCCRSDDELELPEDIYSGDTDDSSRCGVTNVGGLYMTIKGRSLETNFGEYPWVVAVVNDAGKFVCTGALIAYNVVLTTANSLEAASRELFVRAGEWDLMTDKEYIPHVNIKVKNITRHENFNWQTTHYNAALLILESAFPRKRHISPICLFDSVTEVFYDKCFIVGWRSTARLRNQPREIAVKVDMTIDSGSCSVNSISTEICAVANTTHAIYANGAPLVCPTDSNIFYIVGSWSITSDDNVLFTDIRQLSTWIREKLKLFRIFI